jgi:hypothetical protein
MLNFQRAVNLLGTRICNPQFADLGPKQSELALETNAHFVQLEMGKPVF